MADDAATSVEQQQQEQPPVASGAGETSPPTAAGASTEEVSPAQLTSDPQPQEPSSPEGRGRRRETSPQSPSEPPKMRDIERALSSSEVVGKGRVLVKVMLLDGLDCLLNCAVSDREGEREGEREREKEREREGEGEILSMKSLQNSSMFGMVSHQHMPSSPSLLSLSLSPSLSHTHNMSQNT